MKRFSLPFYVGENQGPKMTATPKPLRRPPCAQMQRYISDSHDRTLAVLTTGGHATDNRSQQIRVFLEKWQRDWARMGNEAMPRK